MSGASFAASRHACLLNNLAATLIENGLCLAGGRVLLEASRFVRDPHTNFLEEEENELVTLLLTLKKQSTHENRSLPLLFRSGSMLDARNEKPFDLPFPQPFSISNEKEGVKPNHCCDSIVFNLGVVYYQIGNVNDALECFALAITSTDVTIKTACFNNIAMTCCYQGHRVDETCIDSAYNYLQRELVNRDQLLNELTVRTLLTAGFIQYNQCNYQGALTLCLRAQSLPYLTDQDEACLLYNIGLLRYHLCDWVLALENFQMFVKKFKANGHPLATALYFIGVSHWHQGDFRRSFVYLVQSLTLEPESSETWYAIAKLLDDSGDLECALKAYEKALQRSDENSLSSAMILVDIGRIHHIQCSIDDSLLAYKKALPIIRRHYGEASVFAAKLLNITGILCIEQGSVKEAMLAFTDAMRISPNELSFHHRLPYPKHPHAACA